MMNSRQLSALTPALLSVVFAAGLFAMLVTGSEGLQTIGAATPDDLSVSPSSTTPEFATAPQSSPMPDGDLSQTHLQIPLKPHMTMTEPSLGGDVAHAPIEPTKSAAVRLASVNPSDLEPVDTTKAAKSIETVDECLAADLCIDRYLWALYQRTPKEDTVRTREWRKVAIKRKGKRVMVSRAFTKLVDQDFGWKDPKAAKRAGMSMMDYVIGGMDRGFKLKLFHMFQAAEAAGLSPGITSGFRDDYRQSIASGLKAASNRSYHGGSLRGGYGHGLAADVVSIKGGTRDQRYESSEKFWKWIDAHGKEFGIGRPYHGRDPPHVAPLDGEEYAKHNSGTRQAASDTRKVDVKKVKGAATRDRPHPAKRPKTATLSKLKAS